MEMDLQENYSECSSPMKELISSPQSSPQSKILSQDLKVQLEQLQQKYQGFLFLCFFFLFTLCFIFTITITILLKSNLI